MKSAVRSNSALENGLARPPPFGRVRDAGVSLNCDLLAAQMRYAVMKQVSSLISFLLPIVLLGSVAACDGRTHADFELGMARSEVLSRFGQPEDQQILFKSSNAIFGPIEDFWPRVPEGAKVEIWSYKSTQSNSGALGGISGSTELYFVNGSNTVDGIGFAVKGAVY
jgi:hypothetical protein